MCAAISGFHGLTFVRIHCQRIILEQAPAIADKRIIAAHLGNGASLCALNAGRSVDSTMGFSALDGLPMGTRCGQLEFPGVILYLLARTRCMTASDLESLFYKTIRPARHFRYLRRYALICFISTWNRARNSPSITSTVFHIAARNRCVDRNTRRP